MGYETPAQAEANKMMRELAQPKPIETADDPVNPKHYRGDLVMRIIRMFDLGFELGNVIKYILRHGAKAGLEDLKKARWYLNWYIEWLEGKHPEGVQ